MTLKNRMIATIVAVMMTITPVLALSEEELSITIHTTATYLAETVTAPQIGSTGGEWAVIGLARSGYDLPQSYWDDYYSQVVAALEDSEGVLHDKKYTEYSRVILALTAIGADPTDVGGYNLLTPLGDYDNTVWQGINGPSWALIALDSGNYSMPICDTATTQASRVLYVQYILNSQLEAGGWSLLGESPADPDVTGMVLQALTNYRDVEGVDTAIDNALTAMSSLQDEDGGYASWGGDSSECVVQMLVALTALNISVEDERFVKNGSTLLDNLMGYSLADGSFAHGIGGDSNLMATEQALYGMVALQRSLNGDSALYLMEDVTISVTGVEQVASGLAGKHEDITAQAVVNDGMSFPDIGDSEYQTAILDLASRGILNGNPDGNFYPENTMTRAEFATMIVGALGLPTQTAEKFMDVEATDWFAPYVGSVVAYGIVNGRTDNTFDPQGTITRQEAATMVTRATVLCGMEVNYTTQNIRDLLAGFLDYTTVADYAQSSVAFCYDYDILDTSVLYIQPEEAISRGEIAQMVYRLLGECNLR